MHVVPRGFTSIHLVTSEFHLPRTKVIFDAIFALNDKEISVSYSQSPNEGLTTEQIESRMQRELFSLEHFNNKTKPRLKNLEELHTFIFEEHDCYRSGSNLERIGDD